MKGYEIIALVFWLVLMPILGILGYVYDISWMLYVFGGIILLTNIFFLFTGALTCLGVVMLGISCLIGYNISDSFWIGLLLGSCITSAVLSIGLLVVVCFSGVSTVKGWLKGKRGNNIDDVY